MTATEVSRYEFIMDEFIEQLTEEIGELVDAGNPYEDFVVTRELVSYVVNCAASAAKIYNNPVVGLKDFIYMWDSMNNGQTQLLVGLAQRLILAKSEALVRVERMQRIINNQETP